MGYWYVIVPRHDLYDRRNWIRNPSFEINVTDNWTASGTTPSQLTSDAVYGLAACRLTTGSGDNYVKSTAVAVADDETVIASAFLRNNTSTTVDASVRIYDTTNTQIRATTTITAASDWIRVVASWKNETGSSANVEVRLGNFTSATVSQIDVDAVQLTKYGSTVAAADCVELDYYDGDSEDAYWMARAHGSWSETVRDTRIHGQILNLANDLDLAIETVSGAGLPSYQNTMAGRSFDDGAYVQRTKARERVLILRSRVSGSTLAGLYDKRLALVKALRPDRGRRNKPIRLFHLRPDESYGDPDWRELRVHYDSGLDLQKVSGYLETFALRLIAPDPYFYREKWDHLKFYAGGTLGTNNDMLMRQDGKWSLPNPTYTNGAPNFVYWSANLGQFIYGGTFTNYIMAYNPATNTFSQMGTGGLNAEPRAAQDGPDGQLYVVGDFTTAGGATANKVAKWDGSSWTNLVSTAPASGDVYDLCFDERGDLYVCGDFVDLNGSLDKVARYDVSAGTWGSVGSVSGGTVTGRGIEADYHDHIYLIGDVTSAGGTTVYKIARYNITANTWSVVGNTSATSPGISGGTPYEILRTDAGDFYICGTFDTVDDESLAGGLTRLTSNGIFYPVGDLANGTVGHIAWDSETGELYALDISAGDNKGRVWNGSTWYWIDFDLSRNYLCGDIGPHSTLLLAMDGGGLPGIAGSANDIWIDGSERTYPVMYVSGLGGFDRRLINIVNTRSGAGLYFERLLAQYETVTIDCRPGYRTMSSNFGGTRFDFLGNSALADFYLMPGYNRVRAYLHFGSSLTMIMKWRATFGGID